MRYHKKIVTNHDPACKFYDLNIIVAMRSLKYVPPFSFIYSDIKNNMDKFKLFIRNLGNYTHIHPDCYERCFWKVPNIFRISPGGPGGRIKNWI